MEWLIFLRSVKSQLHASYFCNYTILGAQSFPTAKCLQWGFGFRPANLDGGNCLRKGYWAKKLRVQTILGQKSCACKPFWGNYALYVNKRSQRIHTHVYKLLINATALHQGDKHAYVVGDCGPTTTLSPLTSPTAERRLCVLWLS